MNNIKMLYYNRIDVSERIDVNKTNTSKECDMWCVTIYFLNKGFKFQPIVCNRYHDLLMMFMNFSERLSKVPIIAELLAELAKVRP